MKSTKHSSIKKFGLILLSAACLLSVISLSVVVAIGRSKDMSELPMAYSQASYAYDITDPKQNAGVADYIFIGYVSKILRTEQESQYHSPETVYEIEVLENLKGEIQPTVELYKRGGVIQKGFLESLYIGRTVVCYEGDFLPKIGDVCMFYTLAQEDGRLADLGGPPSNPLLAKGETSLKELRTHPEYLKTVDAIAHQVVPKAKWEPYIADVDVARQKD